MPTTKLTRSVHAHLIREAQRLAPKKGMLVSPMFTRYVEQRAHDAETGPSLLPLLNRQVTGLIRLPATVSEKQLIEDDLVAKPGFRE